MSIYLLYYPFFFGEKSPLCGECQSGVWRVCVCICICSMYVSVSVSVAACARLSGRYKHCCIEWLAVIKRCTTCVKRRSCAYPGRFMVIEMVTGTATATTIGIGWQQQQQQQQKKPKKLQRQTTTKTTNRSNTFTTLRSADFTLQL